MKQTIYVVVKKTFGKNNHESAYIVGMYATRFRAANVVRNEYKTLKKYFNDAVTYAELSEFGSVRGLIRTSFEDYSFYIREVEVDLG